MDISIIEELRLFEGSQKKILEEKKNKFLQKLDEQKKDIIEKNEKEISELVSNKHALLKEAEQKAKEDALSTIKTFNAKTAKLKKQASKGVEPAVRMIFGEFLDQNV